jgi:hypothetical protein
MAQTMLDKKAAVSEHSEWPAEIKAEFERESRHHNGCVGTQLLSETDKVRVWIIRLQPGERVGFHRHVLDYQRPGSPAGEAARCRLPARHRRLRGDIPQE